MSEQPGKVSPHDPQVARRNVRLALLLGGVALAFFVAFFVAMA